MEFSKYILPIPFLTLLSREVRRFFKVILQTVATPLISTTLYLLIFGISIGSEISVTHNYSYLTFLIPGLVVMAALRNAYENTSSSIVISKFGGELEDLRIVPLSTLQINWAHGLAACARAFIIGILTYVIGAVFYYFENHSLLTIEHPLLALFLLFIGSLTFSNLGLSVSMHSNSFEQTNAINTFLLTPLIYLGGVFFSLQQLHPIWQTLSQYNPLLYIVNGFRYAMLGSSDIPIQSALIVTISSFLILHLISLYSLKKGSFRRW